jgi:hypothetical protein
MKKGIVMFIWVVLLLVVGAAAYVRLAPSDQGKWHKAASFQNIEEKRGKGFYIWRQAVEDDGTAALAALDRIIRAEPRTALLAGSLADKQLTYVSRSKVVGFPDYTTIGIYQTPDGQRYLEVYGRLRFGRSDLGVNAKRIKGWLGQLQV